MIPPGKGVSRHSLSRRYVKNRVKTIFFILVKIIFKWFFSIV